MTSPESSAVAFVYCDPAIPAFFTILPQRTISDLTNVCISGTERRVQRQQAELVDLRLHVGHAP